MPSPFPGMDPYLEGALWADFHHCLATEIRRRLTPQIRPRYVARVEVYVVEDTTPEAEIGIMYPDVEVLERAGQAVSRAEEAPVPRLAAPLVIPAPAPVPVRVASVEVRDTDGNRLVTAIEILSPVNKREPGRAIYLRKRQRLRAAEVHLLEIDLLRRGTRPVDHSTVPDVPYLVALTRAGQASTGVWPIPLSEPLPVLPIPLRAPDADAELPLGEALASIYEEAAYELSVDYGVDPPLPPLSEKQQRWLRALLDG